MVQYAHCLKEQGKFIDAECYYRAALALGETSSDLLRHLAFAAERGGNSVASSTINKIIEYWSDPNGNDSMLSAPPTVDDIEKLYDLILGHRPGGLSEIRQVMNEAATCAEVVMQLCTHRDFAKANRDLLAFLVETHGTQV